jgi:hypothetical protein
MEIKQFRKKYDLELISASNAEIILGRMVFHSLFGRPKFQHAGMPHHIFNAFLDAKLLSKEDWETLYEDIRSTPLIEAQFAESTVNVETNMVTDLEYPEIGKLENSFELSKIRKFTFGDLQARVMSNLMRVRIDDYLELLKRNHWEDYDGRIRKVFMITELYYGSIKIVIEREFKENFEAGLKNTNLKVKNEISSGKSVEYTFDHQDVPFAMRIEKVRTFNG